MPGSGITLVQFPSLLLTTAPPPARRCASLLQGPVYWTRAAASILHSSSFGAPTSCTVLMRGSMP
jgi:hypothetical protein